MNILLGGYFDKNFGDDAMHQMVVKNFPMHNFYVECNQREMLAHLEKYENVHINTQGCEIDMFLNVIGTGFLYNGKRSKTAKILNMLTSKTKKYPKTALVNCSLENFDGKLSQWLTKYDLNKYDFITCRDNKTYAYLTKNIKNARIEMHNDIVFAQNFTSSYDNGEFLGIAPIRRLYSDTNFEYYREMAKFADNYIEKYNKRVRLFAFDSGIENDISAVLSVKSMMRYGSDAELIIYNSDTEEFAKKISECEVFAGSRFHSIIIALMFGINTVAVYDNEKIKRLCNDFNITGIKKSEFTHHELMKCIENSSKISNLHYDAIEHINSLSRFMMEQV